jgi:hypothetical protein
MNLETLGKLAVELPEAVRQNALDLVERMGEVIEGIGDRPVEWRANVLKLVQAMSDRSKLPKGTGVGDFLLGEDTIDQPLDVIVLRTWNARQYWSPDQNEAKMLCSSPDGVVGYIGLECKVCPHSKFNEETKKTECNLIKQFMVLKSDLSDVFMVNFAKTNYKAGGDWQMLMKKAGVAPYRRMYGLRSEDSKQYKNVSNIAIDTYSGDKRDTPKEYLAFVTELFNQVSEDRKTSVDEFHKMIFARRSNPALIADQSGADSVVLLGNDSSDVTDVVVTSDTPAPTAGKSNLAKKYVV